MDAKINSATSRAATGSQNLIDSTTQSLTQTCRPSDDMREIRIAVAEYARQNGMCDPVDVLRFTRICIREASQQLVSIGTEDTEALFHLTLRIASESCGVYER